MGDLIFDDGFRANVGIVIFNKDGKVFFAKRKYQSGWQFPQGGMDLGETPEQAMFRELHEEVGLKPEHVKVLGVTSGWLRYHLPRPQQLTTGVGKNYPDVGTKAIRVNHATFS